MHRTLSLTSATILLLGACAVGPDFSTPAEPDVSAYDYMPLSSATADGAQTLLPGEDIPAEWWALYHSKELNAVVVQAIRNNPDLETAEAALRVAEDNLAVGESSFFPTVGASFSSQRARVTSATEAGLLPSFTYTLHTASVNVSYNPDVWGGARRTVEQLQAQVDSACFQKEAVHLTLTANVVTLAINEATLREQISAAKEIIAAQERTLNIFKVRFDAGAVGKSEVLSQQSSLAAVKAALPALQHQLAVTRHALSAIVGELPEKQIASEFTLADLKLPAKIPLSIPSKLVRQRPDVRAAEADLHAASAAIGIAEAARLPNFMLTGDIGSMANKIEQLFSPGGTFWSVAGSVTEKIFDAGALANREQAARDAYTIAAAQYRKTVLAAFQDVADTLHALQSDAENLVARQEAEKAAAENMALIQVQFEAGAVSTAELLLAQQAERQAKALLVRAQGQRYADTAALFTALGGGWWNRGVEGKQAIE